MKCYTRHGNWDHIRRYIEETLEYCFSQLYRENPALKAIAQWMAAQMRKESEFLLCKNEVASFLKETSDDITTYPVNVSLEKPKLPRRDWKGRTCTGVTQFLLSTSSGSLRRKRIYHEMAQADFPFHFFSSTLIPLFHDSCFISPSYDSAGASRSPIFQGRVQYSRIIALSWHRTRPHILATSLTPRVVAFRQ